MLAALAETAKVAAHGVTLVVARNEEIGVVDLPEIADIEMEILGKPMRRVNRWEPIAKEESVRVGLIFHSMEESRCFPGQLETFVQ